MRPHHRITHPRALHPGAWWLWALGLAAAASRTGNPVPLFLVIAVTWFVVSARRGDTPWAASYALFFRIALLVIAIHMVFQTLLSGRTQGDTVLFSLPQAPLPEATGIQLGGDVTLEALLVAFYTALQLAAIFCCIGAANALGSARQLLRYVPGALYEIGVACVIALTFAPQLAQDARRVRQAARLRGGRHGRVRRWGRLAMPMVEGALERSVDLAAAMDSRGYGRTTLADAGLRRTTSALVVLGSLGACIGVYGLLAGTAQAWLGLPTLLAGCALGVVGLAVGGRRTGRTRYRPDPWALPELLVVACGAAAAVAAFWQVRVDPASMVLASPTEIPAVPVLACLGIVVGMLPAVVAPPLPRPAAPASPAARPAAVVPSEVAS